MGSRLLLGQLHGAKLAAVARGELRFPLPVGYVFDADGRCVLDPDQEVHAAVADLFAAFTATGSADKTVGEFTGRKFPLRANGGTWAGQLRWGQLSHARVLDALTNPCYAGVYVYDRSYIQRRVLPDGSVRSVRRYQPRAEWPLVHPLEPPDRGPVSPEGGRVLPSQATTQAVSNERCQRC